MQETDIKNPRWLTDQGLVGKNNKDKKKTKE